MSLKLWVPILPLPFAVLRLKTIFFVAGVKVVTFEIPFLKPLIAASFQSSFANTGCDNKFNVAIA